jgi:hypothetical protein
LTNLGQRDEPHEQLAGTEKWKNLVVPTIDNVEFLLHVIRDQRAELTQAREAITNMRGHFDVVSENHKQNLVAIGAVVRCVGESLK